MSRYTAQQIKDWDVSRGPRWIPCRPVTFWKLTIRIRLAWGVFIGRYDALDWEDGQ